VGAVSKETRLYLQGLWATEGGRLIGTSPTGFEPHPQKHTGNAADERQPVPAADPIPQREIVRKVGLFITVLLFASGILLLIICLNVAGMMLARSESRFQEMGIRTALGASHGEIIRQLLTESLLLAIPGVLFGLLLGQALLKLIILKMTPPAGQDSRRYPFPAFCVLLTGTATLFFGLARHCKPPE